MSNRYSHNSYHYPNDPGESHTSKLNETLGFFAMLVTSSLGPVLFFLFYDPVCYDSLLISESALPTSKTARWVTLDRAIPLPPPQLPPPLPVSPPQRTMPRQGLQQTTAGRRTQAFCDPLSDAPPNLRPPTSSPNPNLSVATRHQVDLPRQRSTYVGPLGFPFRSPRTRYAARSDQWGNDRQERTVRREPPEIPSSWRYSHASFSTAIAPPQGYPSEVELVLQGRVNAAALSVISHPFVQPQGGSREIPHGGGDRLSPEQPVNGAEERSPSGEPSGTSLQALENCRLSVLAREELVERIEHEGRSIAFERETDPETGTAKLSGYLFNSLGLMNLDE